MDSDGDHLMSMPEIRESLPTLVKYVSRRFVILEADRFWLLKHYFSETIRDKICHKKLEKVTAPMVTTLLFVIVFSVAIDRSAGIKGISYMTFLYH